MKYVIFTDIDTVCTVLDHVDYVQPVLNIMYSTKSVQWINSINSFSNTISTVHRPLVHFIEAHRTEYFISSTLSSFYSIAPDYSYV